MLRNLVKETANNPGTGTTVQLLGAPTGYISFLSAFGNGGACWYGITDGTQTEIQAGTVTAGSPNTVSRGTPVWTSAAQGNNPSRLNFTGSVTVYCLQPADRAFYADAAGLWQAQSRRIAALADGVNPQDAATVNQVAWRLLPGSVVWTVAQGGAAFTLPAGYTRFRLEWLDVAPTISAGLFVRFSFDNLATLASGASDYSQASNETRAGANTPGSSAMSYLQVSGTVAAAQVCTGAFEFAPSSRMGTFDAAYIAPGPALARSIGAGSCSASNGVAPTHVSLGAIGTTMAQGRARLLGAV